eukprot:26300_1
MGNKNGKHHDTKKMKQKSDTVISVIPSVKPNTIPANNNGNMIDDIMHNTESAAVVVNKPAVIPSAKPNTIPINNSSLKSLVNGNMHNDIINNIVSGWIYETRNINTNDPTIQETHICSIEEHKILIDGYIRIVTYALSSHRIVPSAINQTCLKFYHFDTYKGKFAEKDEEECSEYAEEDIYWTLCNGTHICSESTMYGPQPFYTLLTVPFPKYNPKQGCICVLEILFDWYNSHWTDLFLGVVNSKNICNDKNYGMPGKFGISGQKGYVYKGNEICADIAFNQIEQRDSIVMEYSSKKCELLFLQNNQQIYKMELSQNEIWYPYVGWTVAHHEGKVAKLITSYI